jgi:hypothetical protein
LSKGRRLRRFQHDLKAKNHHYVPIPLERGLKGISTAAQGYCIATDKDGDKAFLTWKGHKSTEPNRLAGDFQWTGGSGKYTGIKGNNTFEAVFVTSNSGYALHKGEWQLP